MEAALDHEALLPRGGEQGRPLRRLVLHRRALHGDLLPPELPGPHPVSAGTSSSSRPPRPRPAGGYRACRRCQPDAVARLARVGPRGDVVARAMRLVADGVVDREGVTGAGTPAQLQRAPVAPPAGRRGLGAGPLALARAQRADTAAGSCSRRRTCRSPDVAFAAGFASIRQFNDTIAAVYGSSPRLHARCGRRPAPPTATPERRSRRPRAGQPLRRRDVAHAPIPVRLATRQPFDGDEVMAFLADRVVPGPSPGTGAPTGARSRFRTDQRRSRACRPSRVWSEPSGSPTCATWPQGWPGRAASSTSTPTRSRSWTCWAAIPSLRRS